jgi:hypothetical protein
MNSSLPAAAAPAAAVEAAPLVAARERVPGSGSAGTAPREAAQVGLAAGSSEARQCRNPLNPLNYITAKFVYEKPLKRISFKIIFLRQVAL